LTYSRSDQCRGPLKLWATAFEAPVAASTALTTKAPRVSSGPVAPAISLATSDASKTSIGTPRGAPPNLLKSLSAPAFLNTSWHAPKASLSSAASLVRSATGYLNPAALQSLDSAGQTRGRIEPKTIGTLDKSFSKGLLSTSRSVRHADRRLRPPHFCYSETPRTPGKVRELSREPAWENPLSSLGYRCCLLTLSSLLLYFCRRLHSRSGWTCKDVQSWARNQDTEGSHSRDTVGCQRLSPPHLSGYFYFSLPLPDDSSARRRSRGADRLPGVMLKTQIEADHLCLLILSLYPV
jgi:hypothetical protein